MKSNKKESKQFHEMNSLILYKEEFHPKVKSDLKKIDKSVVQHIKNKHLDIILDNPLSHLYSYHFRENRVEYRIAYEVVDKDKIIFYYMVAKRENFYKNIQSRI